MIYKYTKCESVIAKVMADLDMSDKNIRITDIREWIFEAVDKIGAPMQYIEKELGSDCCPILKIEDYQVPIPMDLQILDGVAYAVDANGPWHPMRTETSLFKSHSDKIEHEYHDLPQMYHRPFTRESMYTHNWNQRYAKAHIAGLDEDPTYFIKPGWIVTNKKHGYIKLAYKAIAVDERGYPLIPDLSSYQEAIYWYVTMKLSFSKLMKGTLGGKGVNTGTNLYTYIQQQWNFYRNQAYAEAMMPTQDDMESIRNDWNKLIPEYDSRQTFFKNQGVRQTLINDYYYGH